MSGKKKVENEIAVNNALNILKQVSESSSTPRNIRKTLKEVIDMLNDSSTTIGIRAANAISMLDDMSQDPNMPSFARVTIWSGVSALENIRE